MSDDDDFKAFAASAASAADTGNADAADTNAPAVERTAEPSADAPAAAVADVVAEKPAAVEAKPEPKIDWAAAAAKERERREARAKAKAENLSKERAYAEAIEKAKRLDAIEAKKKENPLDALNELGLNFDDLTSRYITELGKDPNKIPELTAAEKRIAHIEAQIARYEELERKREQQRAQEQSQQLIQKLEAQITDTIKAKADDFEILSRTPRGKEIVINLLGAHYEDSGELMDIGDACRMVEAELEAEIKPLLEAKKFRAAIPVEKPADKPPPSATLTSEMRQSESRKNPGTDENREFIETALRLHKQQMA